MAELTQLRSSLPPKEDPDYTSELVSACIAAFEIFQDDTLSLDYMGVNAKTRPIVLENDRYKQATKQLKAEKFLEEIEDVNGIIKSLKDQAPNETSYDIRNPKDAANYTKDFKETLNLRLKATEMRRDLLNISRSKDAEENDALNVFFVALTAEEFQAMQNVEIHEGTEETSMKDGSESVAPKAAVASMEEDHTPDKFIIDADGNIADIPR